MVDDQTREQIKKAILKKVNKANKKWDKHVDKYIDNPNFEVTSDNKPHLARLTMEEVNGLTDAIFKELKKEDAKPNGAATYGKRDQGWNDHTPTSPAAYPGSYL